MLDPNMDFVDEPAGERRVPPHDVSAEMSTLGGMLMSKDAVGEVMEYVKAVDFYLPKHEIIFTAIVTLFGRAEPTDVVTVTNELTKTGMLQKVGGANYLHTLINFVPTAANAGYYAEIVADKAILRQLVESGTRITQLGYAAEGEPVKLVDEAQADIFNIGKGAKSQEAIKIGEAWENVVEEIERAAGNTNDGVTGVATGFRELDELTHGFQPGQLILIAARPGIGKSTLALDFARGASVKHDQSVVFFSLEMSRGEIAMRLMSAETRIYLNKIRSGNIDQRGWSEIAKVHAKLNQAPLYIDDSANLTLVEIRSKCRRLKQQLGLKMIVIDYLQLLTSGKKVESRQQEVSEFSRSLKLLAKELGVPVIALSQLNRGSENRENKKPQLSDLRESGSLEQDADIVILLERDPYADQAMENANDTVLHVAKHRNGQTKELTVLFEGGFSRFSEMAQI